MNATSIHVKIVGLLIHTLALTQIRRICVIPSSVHTRNAAEIVMASTNFNDSHSRRTKLVASWNTSDTTEMIQRNSKIVPQWQAGNKKNVLHMHFNPKLSWKSILIYGSVYWYTVVEKLTVNGNSTENKSFILKLHLSTFLQEKNSLQANTSARKAWPSGLASRRKFSTRIYPRVRLASLLTLLLLCCCCCFGFGVCFFLWNMSLSTRTATSYRSHHCRINLSQFTMLYQGP